MNDSPWQPPADGAPEPGASEVPSLPPQPTGESAPSPWSPEGAGEWTRPPEPAVVPPAVGDVPPPPPDAWARPAAGAIPAEPPAGAAAAPTATRAPARKRSKLVVGGAVAAIGALGLAGLFAVQRFSTEAVGGAETADELGADLLAAIEAEDVLGVIDTMLPGEREALGDPFVDMVGELQRLEVLAPDADLAGLLGLDVEFENELVQVRGTNVSDIVNVVLEADATVTLDGATLPIGAFIEEQLPEDQLTELRGTRLTETDRLELELTAVFEGDRWYFSAFHTIAEFARAEAGEPAIPTEGILASGADSPEAAVDRLLDQVESFDLRGLIATLDPSEAQALQRYAPLFLDEADSALAEIPVEWRVDVREFRVEGEGDERTVFIDALGISGTIEDSEFTIRFSDDCIVADMDGESFEQCGTDGIDPELEEMLADAPAIEAFATTLEEAFADIEPVGLELRQRDGAWFVSPVATLTDALLAALRALDRVELDALVVDGEAAIDEFFESFLGGFGVGPDPFLIDDEVVGGDGWVTDDEGLIVEPPDSFDEPIEDAATGSSECYLESKAADATACFERYLATGEIDEFSVPASLLHPECGMAELGWEGGMYDLSDEEYTAMLVGAASCFAPLVERGELEEWSVPFEVLYVDCFEGRNWYTVYDDQAYNERVEACLSEDPAGVGN